MHYRRVLLTGAIGAALLFTSGAQANHSLVSSTGQPLHQATGGPYGDGPTNTALERPVHWRYNVVNETGTVSNTMLNGMQNVVNPRWSASPYLIITQGAPNQENPFGSCTFPGAGDYRICNGFNPPQTSGLPNGAAAMANISFDTHGHIFNANILIDDVRSGATQPNATCSFAGTRDQATGAVRPSSTPCMWYTGSVYHHEVGHVLGLAHPAIPGPEYFGPMTAGYTWQGTQGCTYEWNGGHSCTYPWQHDYDQIAVAYNHLDNVITGPPNSFDPNGPMGPAAPANEDVPVNRLPRDGKWHKLNRDGGAFRMKHRPYVAGRVNKDGSGEWHEEMPAPVITP